jgi:hypothetical protein
MGSLYVYGVNSPDEKETIENSDQFNKYSKLVNAFKSLITNLQFTPVNETTSNVCGLNQVFLKGEIKVDKTGCARLAYSDFLPLLNSIKIGYNELSGSGVSASGSTASGSLSTSNGLTDMVLEYNTGRKDFVLGRMFEDGIITADQYKNAVV